MKEKIGKKLALALMIATVRAVVLSIPDLTDSGGFVVGILEVGITALAYALFAVLSKPLV